MNTVHFQIKLNENRKFSADYLKIFNPINVTVILNAAVSIENKNF